MDVLATFNLDLADYANRLRMSGRLTFIGPEQLESIPNEKHMGKYQGTLDMRIKVHKKNDMYTLLANKQPDEKEKSPEFPLRR